MHYSIKNTLLALPLIAFLSGCATPTSTTAKKSASPLWPQMTKRFTLIEKTPHDDVNKQIKWYTKNPRYLSQLANNATPYLYYVSQQTKMRHMPAEIALLPMVESNYNPFQYSPAGATGLWQIMPGTASGYGLTFNWWYDGRRDIKASTEAALNYINYLHHYLNDDWLLAIAAYNCGEGTVLKAMHHNQQLHKPVDFWSLHLPYQTKMYVPKMLALATIFSHANQYQVNIPNIPNQPYFASTLLDEQMDLSYIAKLAHISLSDVRQLNPAFRRTSTQPDIKYQLLLPVHRVETFKANLAQSTQKHVQWRHHRVQPGETLSQIAAQYHTTVPIVQQVNHLSTTLIHTHQYLQIPLTNEWSGQSTLHVKSNNIAEDHIPGPQHSNYTVKKGDTLISIAKQHHVSTREIAFWNNLKSNATLQPDQKLTLWRHAATNLPVKPTLYTVKAGDSLSQIAYRFHTTAQAIQRLNHLKTSTITVHQTLKLPRPIIKRPATFSPKHHQEMIIHRVEKGESLSTIAHYYRVSMTQLAQWNHLRSTQSLQIGTKITVFI